MGGRLARFVCACLALLAAVAAAPAVAARYTPTYASKCHAASDARVSIAEMARNEQRWHCGPGDWDNTRPAAWLKFDPAAWRGNIPPLAFLSHITRFERITVSAVDANGSIRAHSYASGAVELLENGPLFMVPLPEVRPGTTAVIVRIDRPHNVTVLSEAQLTPRPRLAGWPPSAVALLAMIAGMLVIPLVFDLCFYAVLRERFLLLHAVMVASMSGYLAFSGGLALAFARPSIDFVAIAGPFFFVIGAAASAFFLLEFLESDALPRTMRRLLKVTAWWSVLVPGGMALQFDAIQPIDNRGYFFGFLPVLLVFVAVIVVALVRRSRAVRLVALAWVPILLCSAERILRGIGVYAGPAYLDQLMFFAFALEVVVVWFAVSRRFMAIKEDRDQARLEVRLLGQLSERDPLTGLLNRRAIEDRFAALVENGYRTIAVLDLDHFKAVNDSHGHAVGDEVLRACGRVFTGTPDLLPVRMGGEEFLLMARGAEAQSTIERLRLALSAHIAREVPALEELVSASMGIVQIPADAAKVRFADVYAQADKLLYDAKAAGRNRTIAGTLDRADAQAVAA